MEERSSDGIRWSAAAGVGRIVLDRPERANSLGLAQSRALARAIDEVLDTGPRAVLLTGTGRIFCAGGDIDEMTGAGEKIDQLIGQILEPLHPAIERLSRAPVPIVSALNGAVGGAGVGLALCADTVIATASMKLRTGYTAIGLSPDAGASYFLARRVGSERAKQLFFLSEPIDAQRCLAMGIVDAVHADEAFAAATEALVARLAAAATGSLARVKRLCEGIAARGLREHLDLERELLQQASRGADAREGTRAFLEKRAPRFQGR
jgi:2-(1,2-epoxy-1,2-dihydrophenyl)acetyl-CoA isomerase